jgi:hypothetical protein
MLSESGTGIIDAGYNLAAVLSFSSFLHFRTYGLIALLHSLDFVHDVYMVLLRLLDPHFVITVYYNNLFPSSST